MTTLFGYLIGLIGMWLLSDSVWSICYYIDRKDETFWRNHIVRVVRMALAVTLMIIGLCLL